MMDTITIRNVFSMNMDDPQFWDEDDRSQGSFTIIKIRKQDGSYVKIVMDFSGED